MKDLQKHIDEVFEWFEWDKVHRVMTFLEWEWQPIGRTPTIEEMKEAVEKYLRELYIKTPNGKLWLSGSGGFEVEMKRTEKGEIDFVDVRFCVETWQTGA